MTALGRLVLWCLKHGRRPDEIEAGLHGWLELIGEVRRAPNGPAALATVWRYILAVTKAGEREEKLKRLTAIVGPEGEKEMTSLADYLEEKGRLRGLDEGQRKALLKLLGVRFGELPDEVVARVRAAELPRIEVWLERVLTASTLASVFDGA